MKNIMNGAYAYNDEMVEFAFYTNLSSYDKLRFVDSVVEVLVDGNKYNSIIRNLITDFYIIDIFSDVDITNLKESDFFVDDVEKFLEETNIAEIIKANMDTGLLDELNSAISLNIEYKTGIHRNLLGESLSGLINTLEKKISEIDSENMIDMANIFGSMVGDFTPERVVDAYLNSDIHKQNIEAIEESKINNIV